MINLTLKPAPNVCAHCQQPCHGTMCRRCDHIDRHVPVSDRARPRKRVERVDYELNPEMDLQF